MRRNPNYPIKNPNYPKSTNMFNMSPRRHLTLILLLLLAVSGFAQKTLPLTQWRLSCPDPSDTAYSTSIVVKVPGCLHTDLFDHDLIPDPFYGTN